MTRRWREAFGVGDHRRLTCLSYGLELPSAEAYERARLRRAEREAVVARGYDFRPVPSKYAPPASEKPVRRYDTSLYPDSPFIRMLRSMLP
jgi:hypothetical protein